MAERDPVWIDADPGTGLPAMSGQEMRWANEHLQGGVLGAGQLKVTTASGLAVDVAAGFVVVPGTWGGLALPGKYICANDAAVSSANIARSDGSGNGIASNASANPRLDQLVARVWDHPVDGGSTFRRWRLQIVQGSATSGATLTNRNGAVADGSLPASVIRLADILVPGGNPTSIPSANIMDRRPWAKGGNRRIDRNSNAGGTSDYSTTSGALVDIDTTNLTVRMECSGVPVEIMLLGGVYTSAGANNARIGFTMDGSIINGDSGGYVHPLTTTNSTAPLAAHVEAVPSAGSHVFRPQFGVQGAANPILLVARASAPLSFVVREIVRSNSDNT